MRYWGLLIVTLVLLAPCGQGAFPHYYQGEKDSSLMAIVTYDDVEYGLGDRITITLHLFKGGEPVDADTVEVKIGRYEGEARNDHYKHVSMVRKPLGVYVGEYTIVLEDVPRDWGNMEIIARVELEGDVAWSVRRVYIAPPHDLDLTIHRLDGSEHLRPGEERAFLFLVTLDEKPFDPDHIEVEWRPAGGTWLPHVSAEPTREGKGRYTHTYQAPITNESSREGLWVDVRHTTEEGLNLTAYDHTWMYVQQMHVWAKRVRASMEGSTFDLHISDWEGTAIGDAFVELEYDYRSNDGWTTGREREWTDGGGVARVVLEYEDMVEDSTTVEISGTVTAGDIVQKVKFDMDLRHDDEENGWEPSPYGLDINEDGLVYEPGRDQTLRTKVFLDGEPLKDRWVQCYIASREEVLIYKRTSTDGDGMLSFKFTTPDLKGSMRRIGDLFVLVEDDPYEVGQFDVVFGRPYIDPLWDRSIWEYLEHFQTNEVKVTTETTGRRVDVRVECQQAEDDWFNTIYMGLAYDRSGTEVPEWSYWTENVASHSSMYYGAGSFYQEGWLDDGVRRATFVVPENVDDEGLFVWASLGDPDDPEGETVVSNGVGAIEDPWPPWMTTLAMLLTIFAILGLAWMVLDWRRAGREGSEE